MDNELIFQIALSKIPHIGDVHAKTLVSIFNSASAIFKTSKRQLEKIEGIGSIRANSIKNFNNFNFCEKEIKFIEKNNIQPIFISSENYPKKLLHSADCPVLLYFKGTADLNKSKIISVVGTRNNSEYGKFVCQKLIRELKEYNIIVVSGLAYGIDTIAHQTSIQNNIPTIAVLAHGLDKIYPVSNTNLAKEIIEQGGLLTEFHSGHQPDKQNFPKRNRITAGICDALIVIESGKKGGSLITAEIANSYNKDIFAVPGRIGDLKSEGCNSLVHSHKASIVQSSADIIEQMGWNNTTITRKNIQRSLFIELTNEENKIYTIISENNPISLDEIMYKSMCSNSAIATALLHLEINNLIVALPGKLYKSI